MGRVLSLTVAIRVHPKVLSLVVGQLGRQSCITSGVQTIHPGNEVREVWLLSPGEGCSLWRAEEFFYSAQLGGPAVIGQTFDEDSAVSFF